MFVSGGPSCRCLRSKRATGATTVENLAYAQRLGLWGGADFPFANRAEFVYRQANSAAETIEEARRLALADDDWSGERLDYETSGETRISGIWLGADSAWRGVALPLPTQSDEMIARSFGLRHFVADTGDAASGE